MQRLSQHGLDWPTVDEGLDTAALANVSLMIFGRRNATLGGSGNTLASVSPFSFFPVMMDDACIFFQRGMVSENKGNSFVDLFFFVFQEVISVNFTGI